MITSRPKIHCKMFALLLALVMFLTTHYSITEAQAAEPVDSGTWGTNITWEFDGSTLTFTGRGAMQDAPITWEGHIYTIHTPWATHSDQTKKIVIGEGITQIGTANFDTYFQNLESVSLPTTLVKIRKLAFAESKKLRQVTFHQGLKNIEEFAFYNCPKLNNPTFPNSITEIGASAFSGCNSFTKLVIPSSLKAINDSFSGCRNLTSVTFSNGVIKINEGAFAECYKLKSVDLPASVSSIGFRAFDDCRSLTKLIIRNRNCKISMKNTKFNLTVPKKTVIYGYKGSTAEKYAKKAGNKFKTLSKTSSTKTIKVKKLTITNAPKTLKAGKSKTLKVKVTPSNASNKKITWKSSNKKYATVNSKGKVTAKKAGKGKKVKFTATATDGSKKKVAVTIGIK